MTTLFSPRAPLLERLRAVLPDGVPVAAAPSLEALLYGPANPGVYLIYRGGKVVESRPDGCAVRLSQTWLTVIIARHVGTAALALEAQGGAGAVADRVLTALLGWSPPATAKPLRLVECPAIDLGEASVEGLGLAFETELTYRAPAPTD